MSGYGLGKASQEYGQLNLDRRWCQNLWDVLAEGGTWAVPRTGLVFRKQNGKLRLISMMPYMPEMMDVPISENELRERQDADFDVIREKFGEIRVEVVRDV